LSSSAERSAVRYDGHTAVELEAILGVPRVSVHASVTSTLDVAQAITATAPAGTLVLADEQTAGRGTQGRRWTSRAGDGVWLALIERAPDAAALDVLSIRCGLYAAEALDDLATARIGVKWPNDLYVGGRKLAGVLIETRWRGAAAEWVSIGFGLNVRTPPLETAIGLADGGTRTDALARLAPALRRAASATGHLTNDELSRWASRDVAHGRVVSAPSPGTVDGVASSGELLVRSDGGSVARHRTGTLTFAEPLACS
jgi:BirA family transcriptional regulator, biotin operon repressor / biotin---[acetyl-CoA-carboxylase] ligase